MNIESIITMISIGKILDKEPNYFKRLVSDMIHIKKEDKTINKQTLRI